MFDELTGIPLNFLKVRRGRDVVILTLVLLVGVSCMGTACFTSQGWDNVETHALPGIVLARY